MKTATSAVRNAISTDILEVNGQKISVHQLPIPGFPCFVGEALLAKAAEYAVKNNWEVVVLTWGDSPSSYCFQDGYCYLLALSPDLAETHTRHYEFEHLLCLMRSDGSEFVEPSQNAGDEHDDPEHCLRYA